MSKTCWNRSLGRTRGNMKNDTPQIVFAFFFKLRWVPNLLKIIEQIGPQSSKFFVQVFGQIFYRFLMDLGAIWGAKMEPTLTKKGVGKMMKNDDDQDGQKSRI